MKHKDTFYIPLLWSNRKTNISKQKLFILLSVPLRCLEHPVYFSSYIVWKGKFQISLKYYVGER